MRATGMASFALALAVVTACGGGARDGQQGSGIDTSTGAAAPGSPVGEDPHAGHDMSDSARVTGATDPHAGHDMSGSGTSASDTDPHAGHDMGGNRTSGAAADPHAGHNMPGSRPTGAAADPHAGHNMPGSRPAGVAADPHAGHRAAPAQRSAAGHAGHSGAAGAAPAAASDQHAGHGAAPAPGAARHAAHAAAASGSALGALVDALLADTVVARQLRADTALRSAADEGRTGMPHALATLEGHAKLLILARELVADPAVRDRIESVPELKAAWEDPVIRSHITP
jgi:hypothetical protein